MNDRDQRFSEKIDPTTPLTQQPEAPMQPLVQEAAPVAPTTMKNKAGKMVARMRNDIGKLHLFSAFCENPANVSFQTQENDEHILLFLRKSKWVNAPWIVTTGIFFLIPFLIYALRGQFSSFIPPLNVVLILIPLYYLFTLMYAFVHFVTWYYNAALITDKRVIDIDFHQIVLKDVAETKLALVQDVSYKQDGALPNVFGYGFVLIQTAGTLDNFEFYNLPQPARVVEIVEELIGRRPIV